MNPRSKRLRLAVAGLGLAGLLVGVSGCASARAGSEATAPPEEDAAPFGENAAAERGGPSPAADPAQPEPVPLDTPQPWRAPGDPWTDRAEGAAPTTPVASERVRLLLPSSRLEPVPAERRPALPARARLALVTTRDAWLVRAAQVLLALGRELDDPRLEPVVALGPLSTEQSQVDLEALALEADAQGFDLLLVDVRRGPEDDDRDGVLVHAGSAAVLAVFEVRRGGLPSATGGGSGGDPLDRVGQAYARAR